MSTSPNLSLGELDDRLRRLQREQGSLADDVGGLQHEVQRAQSVADQADEAAEDLRRRITDIDDKLTGHSRKISSTGALVERLGEQLSQLERAVRVSEGVPVIDLDDVPHSTHTLAAEATKRHELKKSLLPDYERYAHQATLQRLNQVTGQLTATEDELVRMVTAMAGNHRNSHERAGMAERFTAATSTRRKLLDVELPAADEAAEAAQRELQLDDVVRARVVPKLQKAEQAWADLRSQLRISISDAIGSSALLPVWFTTSIGVAPPRGPRGDQWMRTATAVLAYRVTYGIRDQALPLGSTTRDGRWSRTRQVWLDELQTQLAALESDG